MKSKSELFNEELPNLILNIFIAHGSTENVEFGIDYSEVLEEIRMKIINMTTIYATNCEKLFNEAILENKKNLKTYKEI
ncbi:MAG: hypothetical protein ACK5L6_03750 [Anaerorhabdus sp.]|uniref:hypothetical protein n=1 Tax=Anaerorhabdus sp. TaxID=1872524 RepID=UPI003A8606E3